ncbi:MAG: hypothetical protein ACRC41_00925 [Sarcina sp.]
MSFFKILAESSTQGFLTFLSCGFSIVALLVSFCSISSAKKIAQNSIKANIFFYFAAPSNNNKHISLNITNFGTSMGLLTKLQISPTLSYKNSSNKELHDLDDFNNLKNIYLHPQQRISTDFPIDALNSNEYNVTIFYKSLDAYSQNKILKNSYTINTDIFTKTYKFNN